MSGKISHSDGANSGRRGVLKRLVVGLGAAALVQPNGGAMTADDPPVDKNKQKKMIKKAPAKKAG